MTDTNVFSLTVQFGLHHWLLVLQCLGLPNTRVSALEDTQKGGCSYIWVEILI